MTNEIAIQTRGLRKTFPGGVEAVCDLDLEIPRGTSFGLIGRNGAGKTTTLRLLMGLLRQDRGEARILGRNLWGASAAHRERVTYVSQEHNLFAWMTLRQLCDYASCLYSRWNGEYAASLARRFRLPLDTQFGLLSGGEKRKVAILLALGARPDVLLLDEPVAGLDPVARRELLDALVEVLADDSERTLVFSSHIISDLERIVDHVGILDGGRLLVSSPVDDLKSRTRRIQIIFEGDRVPPDFALPKAIRLEVEGPVVSAVVFADDVEMFANLEKRFGARLHQFPVGLEDIFIEMVGGVGEADPADRKEQVS